MEKVKGFISKYNLSVVILIVGVLFLTAGFLCPPLGVIDNSVLVGVGEIFGFCAAISGLDTYSHGIMAKLHTNNNEYEEKNN